MEFVKRFLMSPSLGFGLFFFVVGMISKVRHSGDNGLGGLLDDIGVFLGVGFLSGYIIIRMIWQTWRIILMMDVLSCLAVWALFFAFISF